MYKIFLCILIVQVFMYSTINGDCVSKDKVVPIDRNHPLLKESFKKIDTLFKNFQNSSSVPSLGINIIYGDNIIYSKAFGPRDATNPKSPPFTMNDSVRCASITKSLTSLLMYKLRDEGKINITDKLVKFIPQFKMKSIYNSSDSITLAQLASHRSGLPGNIPCRFKYDSESCSFKSVLELLKDMYIEFPENFIGLYSNLGLALLGKALEAKMGIQYDELIRKEILLPLGMKDSHFERNKLTKPLAIPVVQDDDNKILGPVKVTNSLKDWSATGGLFSTPNDLSKYVSFLLKQKGDNRIISYDTLLESFIETTIINGSESLATPWESSFEKNSKFWIRGKSGFFEGYLSYVSIVRELNFGYYYISLSDNTKAAVLNTQIGEILTPVFQKLLCDQTEEYNEILHLNKSKNINGSEYEFMLGTYITYDHCDDEYLVNHTIVIKSIENCTNIESPYCNSDYQLLLNDLTLNTTSLLIPLQRDDKHVYRVVTTSKNLGHSFDLVYYFPTFSNINHILLNDNKNNHNNRNTSFIFTANALFERIK